MDGRLTRAAATPHQLDMVLPSTSLLRPQAPKMPSMPKLPSVDFSKLNGKLKKGMGALSSSMSGMMRMPSFSGLFK
jgi:hypothetical protein